MQYNSETIRAMREILGTHPDPDGKAFYVGDGIVYSFRELVVALEGGDEGEGIARIMKTLQPVLERRGK